MPTSHEVLYKNKLLSLLADTASQQWQQGEPYRVAVGGLLSGDVNPLMGLLNQPVTVNPMTAQEATNMALDWAPMGLGMIKTAVGRIPETHSETTKLADMLTRAGEKKGYVVNRSGSAISPSQYVTFSQRDPVTEELINQRQVRLSNHADKYPELASGVRTSVDPSTEVSFEQAVNWLGRNGYPTSLSVRYKDIPTWEDRFKRQAEARNTTSAKLDNLISAWRNMPKATRGEMPTIDDINNGMTVIDLWRRGK
jgi:hypothetical protein